MDPIETVKKGLAGLAKMAMNGASYVGGAVDSGLTAVGAAIDRSAAERNEAAARERAAEDDYRRQLDEQSQYFQKALAERGFWGLRGISVPSLVPRNPDYFGGDRVLRQPAQLGASDPAYAAKTD